MTFTVFPCISPQSPETHWGQVLDLQSTFAVIEVERPFGGVREEGVAILTRLSRLLSQSPLEKEVLQTLVRTFGGQEVISLIVLSVVENKCTIAMRGDGRVFMRRGKTFSPLLRRAGILTGEVKSQDILLLLSKDAATVLEGEERDLFSENLSPKEIAEAVSIFFAEAGKKAEGAVGCVIAFSISEPSTPVVHRQIRQQNTFIPRIKALAGTVKRRLKETKTRSYVLVGVLSILFLVSVVLGIRHQQGDTSHQHMIQAMEQAQASFDEGISLMDTQPIKSREALKQANDIISPYLGENLPKGKEGRTIETLGKQIQDNLRLVLKVYQKEPQLFFDASFLQKDRHISIFAVGSENISIVDTDNGMVGVISLQSKDAEIVAGGNDYKTAKFLTWNDTRFFVVTASNVIAFDPGDKEGTSVLATDTWDSVATFGNNFYGSNREEQQVWRYPAKDDKFGPREAYFPEDSHADISKTSAMVIDGSIWFGSNLGKIFRYTQGSDDPYLIRGVDPPLGQKLEVATNENINIVFVFDPENRRVVILNKEGTYQAQYVWPASFSPSSFSISPDGKQIFLLSDKKLFTLSVE